MNAIALSDAKARLSALVREVEDEGMRFTIMRNGRPVARLMPIAGGSEISSFGVLSAYADASRRRQEKDAWGTAVKEKYADLS